jgi:hypothetical protein
MALSPPQAAQPGQPYLVSLNFWNESSGTLVDPTALQLDLTYGEEIGFAADAAGPYTYTGSSAPAAGTIWRTGTGQYTAWWPVPATASSGVYVANWTATYGVNNDQFLIFENFPLASGFSPTAATGTTADIGYWTGSLAYQPAWSPSAFTIPFGAVDSYGITWTLLSVQGWDSPPTAVGQIIQRSADHGGWPTAQFYGPRTVTVTLMASAPTQALRDTARALLQQAVPFSDLATLTYNEPVPKVAYVRRNATAVVGETYPTLADVVFSIPLIAPDPRKYSAAQQYASSVTSTIATPLTFPFTLPVTFPAGLPPGQQGILAVNSGTFETRPVITVQGPVTGPSVINGSTGQAVTFTGLSLAASDRLVLNMDARQAYKNGNFTPADPSSAWFVLQPGSSVIYLTGTGSKNSVLSATWASSWI